MHLLRSFSNASLLLHHHFDVFNLEHIFSNSHPLRLSSWIRLFLVLEGEKTRRQINKQALILQTIYVWWAIAVTVLPLQTPGVFFLFIYFYIFFISKFGMFSCIPNMPAYGSSDCGNYLCQLLWTYSIWVSSPDGDALKWLIRVIQMAEQWWDQSSTMLNTPATPHPPTPSHPPRRETWLKAVNGFTACFPISAWRGSTTCACHLWKLCCSIHCCLQ